MKPIDSALVERAIAEHCTLDGHLQFKVEIPDDGGARWIIYPTGGSPDDGVIVRLVGTALACEDPVTKNRVSGLIMDLRQDDDEPEPTMARTPVVRPTGRSQVPAKSSNAHNDRSGESVVDTWRARQDRGYFVKGGKSQVPNAFAVSEEANRRRFNVETDGGRTGEIAWGKARAIDTVTGNFREAKVTFDWSTFRQRQTWEITKNMEKKNPGVVLGIDPETMLPMLDSNIKIDGQPAALYLHLQLLRQWTFADRTAESMAERRAVLKLSNREWREDDEVDVERLEEIAVGEMRG